MFAFVAAISQASPAAAVVNCAAKPSDCGYRDASNTGAAAASTLKRIPEDVTRGTGWYWDSRGWVVINGDGAVFSGYSVKASVSVQADNVTISNCRITTDDMFGIALRRANYATVTSCDIGAALGTPRLMVGIKDIYGDSIGIHIARNDIFNTSTAIQVEQGLINDNYIHDMGYLSGDHINGITSNGGTKKLVIRHNTIFNQIGQTDAIGLFEDFGVQANRVIDNNLLAGGGYTLYAGQNPGGIKTYNISVTNNRFANRFYARSGSYGPATAYNNSVTSNVWSGNVWDHNNAVIPAP